MYFCLNNKALIEQERHSKPNCATGNILLVFFNADNKNSNSTMSEIYRQMLREI